LNGTRAGNLPITLDEYTKSKTESSRQNKVRNQAQTPGKLTSQDMEKILDHKRIKGHHPATEQEEDTGQNGTQEPTSPRDKGHDLQPLLV